MQVTSRRLDVLVAHQHLNGSQVRSLFEHVRRKAVPESMWCDVFLDSGFPCGRLHGFPNHLGRDRLVSAPAIAGAREQIGSGTHPTPVLA
jgi:hypothetical protein